MPFEFEKQKQIFNVSSNSKNINNTEINSFYGLRFLAIMLICIHHLSIYGFGPIAVTFFLVMSGYCSALGYYNKFQSVSDITPRTYCNFLVKKLIKLYPLYLLTFILSMPIMYFTNFKVSLFDSIMNLLMLQSFYYNKNIVFAYNAPSWFCGCLLLFYIVLPFCCLLINKIKKTKYILILCALIFIVTVLSALKIHNVDAYTYNWWFIYISPYFRLIDCLLGFFAGVLFINIKKSNLVSLKNLIIFSFLEILCIFFMYISIQTNYLNSASLKYGLYYIPCSIFMIYIFSYNLGLVAKLFSTKIFIYLGKLNYEIFLLHNIIITYCVVIYQYNVHNYTHDIKHTFSQIILLFLIILISDITRRYFNKPIINRLNNCLEKR